MPATCARLVDAILSKQPRQDGGGSPSPINPRCTVWRYDFVDPLCQQALRLLVCVSWAQAFAGAEVRGPLEPRESLAHFQLDEGLVL